MFSTSESSVRVAVVGVTGETGQSVIEGLLSSPTEFNITALVRPSSTSKPEVKSAEARGVTVVPLDTDGPHEKLVEALTGQEVVITCVIPTSPAVQKRLADAAKDAGVKRFVPSAFGPICPAGGIMALRDVKEECFNHLKKIYLPYTIIDVGWWYQLSLPRLPSGKVDYVIKMPMGFVGEGELPIALTDLKDIGKYVARIITDPRTLNKAVFVHNETRNLKQIFALLKEKSGEEPERNAATPEQIRAGLEAAQKTFEKDPTTFLSLVPLQYANSLWVRGDNQPKNAEYLGYLNGKELYPDLEFTKYEDFVQGVVEGNGYTIYANRQF